MQLQGNDELVLLGPDPAACSPEDEEWDLRKPAPDLEPDPPLQASSCTGHLPLTLLIVAPSPAPGQLGAQLPL